MGKLKHGNARRGVHSGAFKSWRAMLRRCLDPKFIVYPNYGGRGIMVCPEWREFEAFLRDMGERPENGSIDRIDPNKGYEPANCRWATRAEQNRNQRPREPRAECRRGHPFTDISTYIDRDGKRSCKICRAASAQRYREKESA